MSAPDFTALVDLAAERLGGVALAANDEFFAPKENLLRAEPPTFIEGKYTDRGKWMDGWETRRRREPGHDWCLIRLGLPGVIAGVIVDTSHFRGNFPESCSIDASRAERGATVAELPGAAAWREILPRTPLEGHTENQFAIEKKAGLFTHVRLNIFPDGGVARLRVYGTVTPDWERLAREAAEIDLAAVEHGGLVIAASDMFFGGRHNLIMPGDPRNMGDGWETRRRRGPGHDWAIVQLGTPGRIRRIEVDTTHFKGNAPGSCSLDGVEATGASVRELTSQEDCRWVELLPRAELAPDRRHRFEREVKSAGAVSHVRFNIFPDGGVGRLRLFGVIGR